MLPRLLFSSQELLEDNIGLKLSPSVYTKISSCLCLYDANEPKDVSVTHKVPIEQRNKYFFLTSLINDVNLTFRNICMRMDVATNCVVAALWKWKFGLKVFLVRWLIAMLIFALGFTDHLTLTLNTERCKPFIRQTFILDHCAFLTISFVLLYLFLSAWNAFRPLIFLRLVPWLYIMSRASFHAFTWTLLV